MTSIKAAIIITILIVATVSFSVFVTITSFDGKQPSNLSFKKDLPPLAVRAQGVIQLCKQSQGQIYIEEGEKEERVGCLFMPAVKSDSAPETQQ